LIAIEPFPAGVSARGMAGGLEGDRVNFRARCLGDPRGGNPVVHDAPVVHHDRRGRWRLVKDVAGMRRRQNMPIQVAGVEVGCFHKG